MSSFFRKQIKGNGVRLEKFPGVGGPFYPEVCTKIPKENKRYKKDSTESLDKLSYKLYDIVEQISEK